MSGNEKILKTGDTIQIQYQAHDYDTTLDVRATAYKRDGTTQFTDIQLSHVSNGRYRNAAQTMPSEEELEIYVIPYTTFSSAKSDIHEPAVIYITNLQKIINGIWDEAKSSHTVADSFGDYLDDEITSRAAPGDQMALVNDAITSAKIAVDAIGASELAADAVQEIVNGVWNELKSAHTVPNSFGDFLDIEVSSRAVAGDQMNLVDNAITAAKIAVDAIGASELAADAVQEIVNGVWNELKSSHTVPNSFGDFLDIEVSSRAVPGDQMNLVNDAITAAKIAVDAIGASELAADAVQEIVNGVWNELKSAHTVPDSFGDYLDDEVSSRAAPGDQMNLVDDAITAAKIATDAIGALELSAAAVQEIVQAIWDEDVDDNNVAQSAAFYLKLAAASSATCTASTIEGEIETVISLEGQIETVIELEGQIEP